MSGTGQQHSANPVVAKAYWDHLGELLKFTTQIHADYGKWLIVTVTSVHLAALYLLTQQGVPEAVRTDPGSYWPFIIGICAILIAGLITWANWSLMASIYLTWRHPYMLVDPSYWPKPVGRVKQLAIPLTFWGGLVIGIFSAFCVPWGAYRILEHVESPAKNATLKLPVESASAPKSLTPAQEPHRAATVANPPTTAAKAQ